MIAAAGPQPLAGASHAPVRAGGAPAAAGFEAIFVRMMLGAMRKASFDTELFDGSAGGFRDMQDATVADAIAARGLFGFGKAIGA